MEHSGEVALRTIADVCDYRRIIRWMRRNGVTMDDTDGLKSKLALGIYSRLAEAGEVARAALGIEFPKCPKCGDTNDCEKHGFVYDAPEKP